MAVHRQLLSRALSKPLLFLLDERPQLFQVRQIHFNRQKDLELRYHDGKTTRKDENRGQMFRRLFCLALEPKLCVTSAHVSRCKKEVCNVHAHALRKGTGAYGHFCPSPLQDAPSVYPTPCSHRQRDWALPQARARSSYHAQRNLSRLPRTEVAPSLSPNKHNTGKHCEFAEIMAQDCLCASLKSGWLVIHLSGALAMPRCFAKFLKRTSSSEHAARLSLAFSTLELSTGNS